MPSSKYTITLIMLYLWKLPIWTVKKVLMKCRNLFYFFNISRKSFVTEDIRKLVMSIGIERWEYANHTLIFKEPVVVEGQKKNHESTKRRSLKIHCWEEQYTHTTETVFWRNKQTEKEKERKYAAWFKWRSFLRMSITEWNYRKDFTQRKSFSYSFSWEQINPYLITTTLHTYKENQ